MRHALTLVVCAALSPCALAEDAPPAAGWPPRVTSDDVPPLPAVTAPVQFRCEGAGCAAAAAQAGSGYAASASSAPAGRGGFFARLHERREARAIGRACR